MTEVCTLKPVLNPQIQLGDSEKGPSSVKPRFYASPSFIPHYKMANISILQRPFGELLLNIICGKELTSKMRGKILKMKAARHKILFIIIQLKVSCKACKTTINQDKLCTNIYTLSCPSLKRSFLPLNKRNILQHIC